MNKIGLVSTLLLAYVFTSLTYASQFEYGIKTGLICSRIIITDPNSNVSTFDPRFGFDIGIVFTGELIKSLFLETDLRYSPKGCIITIEGRDSMGNPDDFNIKSRIQCFSLPLLANYRFLKHFFVSGGPRFDYLISEENVFPDGIGKGKLNKIDFGFDFGIGINKSIGNRLISSLEFRYSPSFTEFRKYNMLTAWEILFGLSIK